MSSVVPTRASLRKLLLRLLPTEGDVRRICVDYFPELSSRISATASRETQLTELLERVESQQLLATLEKMEDLAKPLAKHRHLLEPVPTSQSMEPAARPNAPASDSPLRRRHVQPPKSAYDLSWYVARKEEEDRALAALEYPGAAVVLQAPELSGKTWLLEHLLAQVEKRGRIVNLHLRAFGPNELFANLSLFLRELARQLAEATLSITLEEISQLIEQCWQRANNPIDNLRWLMVRYILPTCGPDQWLILAIDGVDALGEQPYLEDFFTMLRAWMDSAAQRPFSALRLLLTLSTSPHLLIRNVDGSPFNIAETLTLTDFGEEQIGELARLHGELGPGLDQLQHLVGGHPYLLRLGLYEAQRTKMPLREVLAPQRAAFLPYLEHCVRRLRKQPTLYEKLRKILADQPVALDHDQFNRLRLAGFIVRGEHGQPQPRYPIYRRILALEP